MPDHSDQPAVGAERSRLVRLCWRLTGDAGVAEDLAQETLLEAVRLADKLRDGGRWPWLVAIARYVCHRWARQHGREVARRATAPAQPDDGAPPGGGELPDDADVEVELDRAELADLLDRALALLPPTTREVLLARYVRESSLAETARRLGLSTGAVAMRLHRGKLALRRVLRADLGQDAAASGVHVPEPAGWQPIPLWCLVCGRHRVLARFERGHTALRMRCAWDGCPSGGSFGYRCFAEPIAGADAYRRAFHRLIAEATAYYRAAYPSGVAGCPGCARPTRLRVGDPPWALANLPPETRLYTLCATCGGTSDWRVSGFVMADSAVQRFWHAHPRMRVLPEREVDVGGRPTLVTTFVSTTDAARLEALTDRATLRLVAVHGAPP